MQINRLFKIVYLLLENKTMTAKDLAERFEVSTRTIYRDIDVLSGAGIPVYTTKGRSGGISLLPDFILNKSLLTKAEQNEILFGLQGLFATRASEDDAVFEKLRGFFKREGNDWIEIDFSHWGSDNDEYDKFEVLKAGIMEARVLTFDYYNAAGESGKRRVEPYKLLFKYGAWYLQGYSQEKAAFRLFKVLRMDQVRLSEERFIRAEIELPSINDGGMKEEAPFIEIQLWFPPEMAYRVYDDFNRSTIIRNQDGSLFVNYHCQDGEWAYKHILSFEEKVKVIGPESVKRRLREKVAEILKQYQ